MRSHDKGKEKKHTDDGWILSTTSPHTDARRSPTASVGDAFGLVTARMSMYVPAAVIPNSSASASCRALRIVSTSMSVPEVSWAALTGATERQR